MANTNMIFALALLALLACTGESVRANARDRNHLEGICMPGEISNFENFDWSGSMPYAALGVMLEQLYLPEKTSPYGSGSSTLVVDPINKVIFQSLDGIGSYSWYFANGSYVIAPTSDGTSVCVWTPNGYDYERQKYHDAIFRVSSYNDHADKCNHTIYTGMVYDALSCKERMGATFVTDERNFIHSMSTIFALKQNDEIFVQNTVFQYNLFLQNNENFDVQSLVTPLPESCSPENWLDVCAYYYNNNGKAFTW
jgi:hypothetical protein